MCNTVVYGWPIDQHGVCGDCRDVSLKCGIILEMEIENYLEKNQMQKIMPGSVIVIKSQ